MSERSANKARYFFTPAQLPEGKLQVADFTGEEQISKLYRFELRLVSEDPEIDFAQVVNRPATFTMMRRDEAFPVHGVVADFEQGGHNADLYAYRATLVPRLWRLSLTHQSRIFQEMTVEDIVRQVLGEAGLTSQDFRFSLNSSYDAREYRTQYQETDLSFVSRLLEHEGIQFFFEQGEDQEVVVLTDHGGENPAISGNSTIGYHRGAGMVPDEEETVRELIYRERVVTGKVKVKDYNYETPSATLEAESQINSDMPGMRYEYGPHFQNQSEGERLARVRNEEIESQRQAVDGDSRCLRFRAGQQFELARHYRDDLNMEYLITQVRHVGSQRVGMGLADAEHEVDYRNEFKCIPATVQYRPPRTTPVPRLPGVMTARVESGGGDYPYIDDQGRYRVRMPFDQRDRAQGTASKAIRMAQPHAGEDYGMHFPVHEGAEMVVAHVDGDVDRPLGLSSVPNPSKESPVTSENNTQNIIKTARGNVVCLQDNEGRVGIDIATPETKSRIHMGSEDGATAGIQSSTDATQTIHANEGVFIKTGKVIAGGDAITAAEDFNAYATSVTAIDGAVGAIMGYLGASKLKSMDFAAGVADAAAGTAAGLLLPGIYMASEGGVMMHTAAGISGYAGAGGVGFHSATGIDLAAATTGVNVFAGAGGISIGAGAGGVDVGAVSGGVKTRAKKGNIITEAENGKIEETASQFIKSTAQDSEIEVGGLGVKIHAESAPGISARSKDKVVIEADTSIELVCGGASIKLEKNGTVTLQGTKKVLLKGGNVELEGMDVDLEAKNNLFLVSKNKIGTDSIQLELNAKALAKMKSALSQIG